MNQGPIDDHGGVSPDELGRRAAALVPGDAAQPTGPPTDDEVTSEPLDLAGDGGDQVIHRQPSGRSLGSGEFPDREAPPAAPAPGSTGWRPERTGRVDVWNHHVEGGAADELHTPEHFADAQGEHDREE